MSTSKGKGKTASPPREAWAALVTRPSYVPGLLVLHRTLSVVSNYPLVVLATSSLGQEYIDLLRRRGLTVHEIEPLQPRVKNEAAFERFADTWTKLAVFGVEGYDRLILVDADTIMLRGMDELFTMPLGEDWIGASPACTCNPFQFPHYPKDWIPANCSLSYQSSPTTLDNVPQPTEDSPRTAHLLNSGVVVLRPSKQLMDSLAAHLDSDAVATAQFPDQDVLADVFRGKWKVLPWWCNALKTLRAAHEDLWEDSEVRLLHYILEKPWSKRPAGFEYPSVESSEDELPKALAQAVEHAKPQVSLQNYDELHSWWWLVWDDVKERLGEDRPLVEQWVKE